MNLIVVATYASMPQRRFCSDSVRVMISAS